MSLVPLVFLPGLLCDAALWHHQQQGLNDIATMSVADLTRADNIPALAQYVLDNAPPRFALAGLSMGGYVAQEMMRQAPARVSHLALINTSARADTPETHRRRQGLIGLAHHGKFKGVTPRLLPQLIHPDRLHDAPLCQLVMDMAERVGRDAFVSQQKAILGRVDGRADLPNITVPTLIIVGAEDAISPRDHAEEMAALIPTAELHVLPHCGHLSPLEQPDTVTALLRSWLAR